MYKDKLLSHLRNLFSDELMQLSFGCEVNVRYTIANPRKIACGVFESGDGKDFVILASYNGSEIGDKVYVEYKDKGDNAITEIIGHPPEHRHLLMALQEPSGRFVCTIGNGIIKWGEYIELDLTKPLTDIDEPTAERICKLLDI